MSDDTPRDSSGDKLCSWCGGPIKQAGVGRSRDYCCRSHRQRAYEERKTVERIRLATRAQEAITRDELRAAPPPPAISSRDASRDESVPAPPAAAPRAPAPRPRGRRVWEMSPDEAGQVPLFGRPPRRD